MVALPGVGAVAGAVAVERPPPGQRPVAEVPGDDDRAGVVPPRHDQRGPLAVEVGGAGQEPVDAVAVAVAPRRHGAPRRHVVHCGHSGAREAVEHRQVLRAAEHVAGAVAVVRGGVADDAAGAVDGGVRGLHGDLGAAVAVVVVHLELRVVRPGADVAAEVDPPQPLPVQPVRVHVDHTGDAGLGVVLGVGGVPLQHDLVLAVTVQVADGGVVGRVARARRGDRHIQVPAAGEAQRRTRRGLLHAADDRPHGVGRVRGGAGVQVVRAGGDRRDPGAGTVQVEGGGQSLGAEQPPGDEVAAARAHRDEAAVEVLHLLGVAGRRRRRRGRRGW